MALGCAFAMPSIVGEALGKFDTDEQKEKYLKPYLEGKLVAAEAHKYGRLSLLIVDRGPGVKTEYLYNLLGCRGGGTGRLVFRDVKVPRENLVGELHGGALCFNQMMIPERLTSAAGCLGVWGALDLAVRYSNRRRAFGKEIRNYQAINFIVADSIT